VGADEYVNPVLPGFHPDPTIVRVEDDYYLANSSFSYFPGVPIFHSNDLVHWNQIGHVLDRPSQLDLDSLSISEGIFAPTLRHHDGTFYLLTTLVGGGGNFLVTASNPEGPWSDPVWLPFDGIDPSIFFDDDGRVYITNNGPPPGDPRYQGHRALWIQEYDPDAQEMVGPREVLVNGGVDISEEPVWIEGPHIFKVDGTYYLIAAEGGTGSNHSEVVFRSESVRGPYESYPGNPILTQRHLDPDRPFPVTSAGHADFVTTPDGAWWSVFLATRPYRDDLYNTGRETFLMPVRWTENNWPVITEGSETVPFAAPSPNLPEQPAPPTPKSGNFTIRDDFEGNALPPYWNVIRTPQDRWYDVESGTLEITARAPSIGSLGQPSFIGRRQQHARATASTAMNYVPNQTGDKAGLVAFQNRHHYYALTVGTDDGTPVVQLEKAAGGNTETIASAVLGHVEDGPTYLKVEAEGEHYHFFYGTDPDTWTLLKENADGTILSTTVAGGFVGTYLGLYARSGHP